MLLQKDIYKDNYQYHEFPITSIMLLQKDIYKDNYQYHELPHLVWSIALKEALIYQKLGCMSVQEWSDHRRTNF